MNKLSKKQEKRFDEAFKALRFTDTLTTKKFHTSPGVTAKEVKQFLADELARQKEEIMSNLNAYNVAVCPKCKCLYKAQGHKCNKSIK